MSNLSKAELEELNKELKAKLKEANEALKTLAKAPSSSDLSSQSIGVHKDSKGRFQLVKVAYDVEKNIAVIESVQDLNSTDPAIAVFQSKKYLVEKIIGKVTGNKYV